MPPPGRLCFAYVFFFFNVTLLFNNVDRCDNIVDEKLLRLKIWLTGSITRDLISMGGD